jgi:uncharacterized protein
MCYYFPKREYKYLELRIATTMNKKNTDLKGNIYPCLLPIKIIGKNSVQFNLAIDHIVSTWMDEEDQKKIQRTESEEGVYSSVTIFVKIKDRQHMDDVYKDLQARDHVMLVL